MFVVLECTMFGGAGQRGEQGVGRQQQRHTGCCVWQLTLPPQPSFSVHWLATGSRNSLRFR